jgi:phosphoglycolate phosphatase
MMADDISAIRLFDGIDAVLRQLHERGGQLGIVSSNSEANVRTVLGPATAKLFRHYECGISLLGKASKLRRATKLAGIPIENALYVGDEIRDFEAAEKIGMPFGAVGWGMATVSAFEKRGPCAIFRTLSEMEEYLVS